ncbi:type VI secretion system-associated FHA domain protein TagH [Parendozoicomonas haliclonae]|uniref:FHA domain protein n=1 Tax=Parendozoicomonas haliclonae TaxID=1960125 RepID=A0A1X7ARF2_9GAMM|nr:type VI secretion system-associated FHA domain protein TagH [Parendozoicomonas haliclonae]SMA50668.1 FHA domain protein [Parendozoicomonas haliclonae]
MAEELILEVIDGPVETNMAGHKKVFTNVGGSIGRADSNSWALPDVERIVSSVHADIVYADGGYFIVDKSTNGTFINGTDNPLGAGNKSKLNDGDLITIGHYQIKSTLQICNNQLPDGLGSVDFLDSSDKTTIGSLAMEPEPQGCDAGAQFDDWLEPGQPKAAPGDIWGAIDAAPQPAGVDPLANVGAQDILDPLAALSGGSAQVAQPADPWGANQSGSLSGSQTSSDDWWMSDGDHAPAEQQSMVVPQPVPVMPASQPAVPPVQPQPQFQVAQQPVSVPTPPPTPAPSQSLDNLSLDELLAPGTEMPAPEPVALQPEPVVQQPVPTPQPLVQPQAQPQVPVAQAQPVAPVPEPVPQSAGATAAPSPGLARGLGVEAASAQQLQAVEDEAGAFIRETSSRLIDLLRARSTIKNELRVERTMIQSQDNNPLKFSASAQDALGMMFGASNGAFMSPSEAVRDSFDNISDHQIAVLAAMRSAFEFMMAQFSPQNLESRFNREASKGFMSNKKAKNWEAYQSWFNELLQDNEKTYNQLFGEVFADAYEKKISELNSVRNIQ